MRSDPTYRFVGRPYRKPAEMRISDCGIEIDRPRVDAIVRSLQSLRMGTSFVEYKGCGFWSWDGYLEHVLFLLAEAIGPSPQEPWLDDVRDDWRQQSFGAFTGSIDPNLDEYVTSENRQQVILKLIDEVSARDDLTHEAAATLEFLRRLLVGEIMTDAASPLDYMVTGEHPYVWWVGRNAELKGD